ncbi:glycosyltransferase 87 family protein [Corynebacterium uterequi]|uniref:Putative DUF2029 family protein n=1 Tax=Corynebacterium uterequi TaxID=1072256 RepID=A0A0G3HHU2_9CORY|nr:glycosyltransferase 87 family protein [Corynebacterium uterequi]AKK11503.1 putative DUF2029 family protein [Corynebacterium uterequi]
MHQLHTPATATLRGRLSSAGFIVVLVCLAVATVWVIAGNLQPELLRPSQGDYVMDHLTGEFGRRPDEFSLFGLPMDFMCYWMAGRSLLSGHDVWETAYHVYNGNGVILELPFTYPPIAALFFALWALIPLEISSTLWQVVSLLLWGWIVYASLGLMRLSEARRLVVTPLVTVASFLLFPVWGSFYWGQVNVAIMALILVDFYRPAHRESRFAGVGVGLAAAIKLHPAFFGLLFLAQKRYRAAVTSAVTFFAVSIVSSLVVPGGLRYWVDIMLDTNRFDGIKNATSQSILVVLKRDYGMQSPTLWLVLSAVLTLLCFFALRVLVKRGQIVAACALTGLVMCLVSPFAWYHYYLWLLPLAIAVVGAALMSFERRVTGERPLLLAAGALAILTASLAILLPYMGADYGLSVDLHDQIRVDSPEENTGLWTWWSLALAVGVSVGSIAFPPIRAPRR